MSGDFDFEPVRGLPGRLPEGETLLWQGAPDWRLLARRAFHVRLVAMYFGVFLIWHAAVRVGSEDWRAIAFSTAALAGAACLALAMLVLLAWLTARTTVYSVTNKRVVMRYGIALPMTLNLPFSKILTAGMRTYPNGAGDIDLSLASGAKIAFLVLWPHARAWHVTKPKPMLRALPDGQRAAQVLGRAMAAAAGVPAQAVPVQDGMAEAKGGALQPGHGQAVAA